MHFVRFAVEFLGFAAIMILFSSLIERLKMKIDN
jgi:hypothetical protein